MNGRIPIGELTMDDRRDKNVRLATILAGIALAAFLLSVPFWVRVIDALGGQW